MRLSKTPTQSQTLEEHGTADTAATTRFLSQWKVQLLAQEALLGIRPLLRESKFQHRCKFQSEERFSVASLPAHQSQLVLKRASLGMFRLKLMSRRQAHAQANAMQIPREELLSCANGSPTNSIKMTSSCLPFKLATSTAMFPQQERDYHSHHGVDSKNTNVLII